MLKSRESDHVEVVLSEAEEGGENHEIEADVSSKSQDDGRSMDAEISVGDKDGGR